MRGAYNHRFSVGLRQSVVYNVVKMFLLCMVVLWSSFQFLPKTAHLAYVAKKADYILATNSWKANVEIETNRLSVSEFGEIVINIVNDDSIMVNGQIYQEACKLIIKSTTDSGSLFIQRPDRQDFAAQIHSYVNEENSSVKYQMLPDNTYLIFSSGFQLASDVPSLQFTFFNVEAYLSREGYQDIPLSICEINSKLYKTLTLGFSSSSKLGILNYENNYVHSNSDVSLIGVSSTILRASGSLNFSYSPKATQYDTYDEVIHLTSNDSLEMHVKTNSDVIDSVSLNGMVDGAQVSGMNLFPTFSGWYRDNIYLAPLTLITTIFGGVSLVGKKRK